jgi:hypothetical protein
MEELIIFLKVYSIICIIAGVVFLIIMLWETKGIKP